MEKPSHAASRVNLIITLAHSYWHPISQMITLQPGDVTCLRPRGRNSSCDTRSTLLTTQFCCLPLTSTEHPGPQVVPWTAHQGGVSSPLQSCLVLGGPCSSAALECPDPSSSPAWGLLPGGGLAQPLQKNVVCHPTTRPANVCATCEGRKQGLCRALQVTTGKARWL